MIRLPQLRVCPLATTSTRSSRSTCAPGAIKWATPRCRSTPGRSPASSMRTPQLPGAGGTGLRLRAGAGAVQGHERERLSSSAPARRADSTGRLNPDTGAVVWVTSRPRRHRRRAAVGVGRGWHARLHRERQQRLKPYWVTTTGVWSALDAADGHSLADASDARRRHVRSGDDGQRCRLRVLARPAGPHVRARRRHRPDLWSFPSGGSCLSGAAISNGTVFWGSGYTNLGGTPNNKLFAFGLK